MRVPLARRGSENGGGNHGSLEGLEEMEKCVWRPENGDKRTGGVPAVDLGGEPLENTSKNGRIGPGQKSGRNPGRVDPRGSKPGC